MFSQFSKNIKALRTKNDMTQRQMAEALNIAVQTVVKWEGGSIEKPRQKDVIQAICSKFNVTEQDLFGYADGLYAKIHGLTEAPAGAIAVKGGKSAFVPVRVLGKVHAGVLDDEEQLDGTVEVPASLLDGHPRAFALLTTGTCMNRVIAQGEVVLVDPDMSPGRGSIVVAETEAYEAIMRRWFRGASKLMLSPDSYDEYDDLVFEHGDGSVTVLGVVFWHQAAKELE